METNAAPDLGRPYLVIPKLIEQPTWGGQYIAKTKGWHKREPLDRLKIGQSYELFSGSNFSLLTSSADPKFRGEITDRDAVAGQTRPENSVALSDLMSVSAENTLGKEVVDARGPNLQLLIKYTQALGNSFQVHIRDGVKSDTWEPKPESWYYFEPGLITLGVKPDTDWDAYRAAVTTIEAGAKSLGRQVATRQIPYSEAKTKLAELVAAHDPLQFVNEIEVKAGQLVDLSDGGIHHSWEEDPKRAPLGNVLYEIQYEALDRISTFRDFDKGKMEPDGSVRPLQIEEYFSVIDRSRAANDPQAHLRDPQNLAKTSEYQLDGLLRSTHYSLDRLTFTHKDAIYHEDLQRFKHLFVKSGSITVTASGQTVTVTEAHSCFVPAGAEAYAVTSMNDYSEVLLSY